MITRDDDVAAFVEAAVSAADINSVGKWVVNEIPREQREAIAQTPLRGEMLGRLIALVERGDISSSAGREVLGELLAHGGDPEHIVAQKGLRQVSDESALTSIVEGVLSANLPKVEEYRGGRAGLMGFFVGQVMARSGGRANPSLVKKLLEDRLNV